MTPENSKQIVEWIYERIEKGCFTFDDDFSSTSSTLLYLSVADNRTEVTRRIFEHYGVPASFSLKQGIAFLQLLENAHE